MCMDFCIEWLSISLDRSPILSCCFVVVYARTITPDPRSNFGFCLFDYLTYSLPPLKVVDNGALEIYINGFEYGKIVNPLLFLRLHTCWSIYIHNHRAMDKHTAEGACQLNKSGNRPEPEKECTVKHRSSPGGDCLYHSPKLRSQFQHVINLLRCNGEMVVFNSKQAARLSTFICTCANKKKIKAKGEYLFLHMTI